MLSIEHITYTKVDTEVEDIAKKKKSAIILGGRWRRGRQRIRWLDGIIDLMDRSYGKFQERVRDRKAWHAEVSGITRIQT